MELISCRSFKSIWEPFQLQCIERREATKTGYNPKHVEVFKSGRTLSFFFSPQIKCFFYIYKFIEVCRILGGVSLFPYPIWIHIHRPPIFRLDAYNPWINAPIRFLHSHPCNIATRKENSFLSSSNSRNYTSKYDEVLYQSN